MDEQRCPSSLIVLLLNANRHTGGQAYYFSCFGESKTKTSQAWLVEIALFQRRSNCFILQAWPILYMWLFVAKTCYQKKGLSFSWIIMIFSFSTLTFPVRSVETQFSFLFITLCFFFFLYFKIVKAIFESGPVTSLGPSSGSTTGICISLTTYQFIQDCIVIWTPEINQLPVHRVVKCNERTWTLKLGSIIMWQIFIVVPQWLLLDWVV